MPERPAAERSEQPTPQRLKKAREKGHVPQSQELASALTLIGLLIALALSGPNLLSWFSMKMKLGLSGQTAAFDNTHTLVTFLNQEILDSILVISPLLAAILIASMTASFVVGGINFSPQAVGFKWDSINPSTVLQNLFSPRSLVHFIASIAKLLFVSIIVWLYLNDQLDSLASLRWTWSTELVTALTGMIFGLCLRIAVALLILGIADAFYQRWHYTREIMMTRQEVKQERRDLEGSPEVKARIRRIQIQLSMRRFLQEVPKASVILVNPTHVAVALRYNTKTMDAPLLVAKGADHLAERIIKIGRSYGVPIVRRPDLARTIYATIQPGSPIPESLYVAVAEVLAMIYRLRQKKAPSARR
jgi:flagellar biosynthetic protein FlhB